MADRITGAVDSMFMTPNVGGNLPVEAGADWPRKDNVHRGLERPGGACRSGSGSPTG